MSIAFAIACYQLSPQGVVVSGNQSQAFFTDLAFLNIYTAFGFWDYGLGGTWSAAPDSYFLFTGTGELTAAPTVIPVPAPVLMLGSGLAALGGLALRDRQRRRAVA